MHSDVQVVLVVTSLFHGKRSTINFVIEVLLIVGTQVIVDEDKHKIIAHNSANSTFC